MAGHSHWANIAHKKALVDNKRGKIWSRLSKAIIVAAKMGGGNVGDNPRLRLAVSDAKSARMPKDTIDRAIKKGTGELEGSNMEEVLYEGYGPAGVALMVEILTDNRNRTAPEIRKAFETYGGNLGGTGCVAWMFAKKGLFLVPSDKIDEDKLTEIVLEAGGDDIRATSDGFEVTCEPAAYVPLANALEAAGIEATVKKLTFLPSNTVDLDADNARRMLKLMEVLDDHDDVQNVAANFNIADEVMAEIEA